MARRLKHTPTLKPLKHVTACQQDKAPSDSWIPGCHTLEDRIPSCLANMKSINKELECTWNSVCEYPSVKKSRSLGVTLSYPRSALQSKPEI